MRRLLIAFGVVVYALLFGEGFLRVFDPQALVPRYVTGATDGVRANIANATFRQWTPEVDVSVHYNDAGMRDDRPAPPKAKPPGECRVALLGDSYFVGFESDYPNSFAKRLEDDLRARGYPCRVLDFAVSGFGTAEMLVALRTRALLWHPDVVLMSWHATDPVDNIRSGLFGLDDTGRLVARSSSFLPGVETSDALMRTPGYAWLIQNSQLYSAVRERAGVLAKSLLAQSRVAALNGGTAPAPAPAAEAENEPPPLGSVRPGYPALDAALIFAINDTATQARAKFMLFEIPAFRNRVEFLSMLSWVPQQVLFDLPVASPVTAFRAAASRDSPLYLERGHRHWTVRGNAIAARAAADAIERRGWLTKFRPGAGAAAG